MEEQESRAAQASVWRGTVERIGWGGLGVGRMEDGRVILLSAGVALFPGEVVEAAIEEKPRHAEGQVTGWQTRDPRRVKAACSLAGRCGGCDLWEAGAQTGELKRAMVEDLLHRQLRVELEQLRSPWQWLSAPAWARRHRVQLHWDGKVLGFLERRSHRIVAAERCPMAADPISMAIPKLRDWLLGGGPLGNRSGRDPRGMLRERTLLTAQRWELATDTPAHDVMVTCDVLPGRAWRWRWGRWIESAEPFTHHLERKVQQSPGAFFQTSPAWAWKAFGEVLSGWGIRGERLYDLYGGGGFFSMLLMNQFKSGLLVESDPLALKDADENLMGQPWRIEAMDVELGLSRYCTADEPLGAPDDVVLLDPPRSGLSSNICKSLQHCEAGLLVLVGCDGASFCRDVKRLAPRWGLEQLSVIDLFPNTVHVECVGLLVNRRKP